MERAGLFIASLLGSLGHKGNAAHVRLALEDRLNVWQLQPGDHSLQQCKVEVAHEVRAVAHERIKRAVLQDHASRGIPSRFITVLGEELLEHAQGIPLVARLIRPME